MADTKVRQYQGVGACGRLVAGMTETVRTGRPELVGHRRLFRCRRRLSPLAVGPWRSWPPARVLQTPRVSACFAWEPSVHALDTVYLVAGTLSESCRPVGKYM